MTGKVADGQERHRSMLVLHVVGEKGEEVATKGGKREGMGSTCAFLSVEMEMEMQVRARVIEGIYLVRRKFHEDDAGSGACVCSRVMRMVLVGICACACAGARVREYEGVCSVVESVDWSSEDAR